MTKAIWLDLVRDIMPIQILTKFGDDWTKASKVIELTTYWMTPARPYTPGKTIIQSLYSKRAYKNNVTKGEIAVYMF